MKMYWTVQYGRNGFSERPWVYHVHEDGVHAPIHYSGRAGWSLHDDKVPMNLRDTGIYCPDCLDEIPIEFLVGLKLLWMEHM
jgi:hypothetical protein